MGFLKPKPIIMPAAAAAPPPPAPTPPPASIEDTYKDDEGKDVTAKQIAQEKIKRKKAGMSQTIMTGPQGVKEDADIYTPTLLG
jgi:hypothetical protein